MEGIEAQRPVGYACRICGEIAVNDLDDAFLCTSHSTQSITIDLRSTDLAVDVSDDWRRHTDSPRSASDPTHSTDTLSAQSDHPARYFGLAGRVQRSHRIWLVLTLLACVPVAAWWIQRIVDTPAHGWFEGTTTFEVGGDFAVFYTGGALVADGDAGQLYDVSAFQDHYAARTGLPPTVFTAFGNPPAFAVAVAPLAAMPWVVAWIVWTVLSLAALAAALALFGVPRPLLVTGIVLLTLPAYLAIANGQSPFFWLLIIAGVFVALRRDSKVAAGALAGLLILKPPLLIGFALWWLIDRRMHRALLAAMASAAGIVVISLPVVGRAWLEYPIAASRFADLQRESDGLSMQFSPWGFIDLLIPGHPGLATVVGFSAALLGVAAFVIFYRHHRGEWQLLFAASIVATLWISPHVNAYDWVLLIAALAVLWRSRPASAGVWMSAAIVLAFGSLWSILLTNLMRDGLGWAIKLAVPILAMVAWLVARHLRTNRQSGLAPITVRHFSPTQPM